MQAITLEDFLFLQKKLAITLYTLYSFCKALVEKATQT